MKIPSKEQLEFWYVTERKSTREIAGLIECSQTWVRKIMQDLGIPRRTYKDNTIPTAGKFGKEHPKFIDGRSGYREVGRKGKPELCEDCGRPPTGDKRRLEVHHMDHDRTNADPDNLRLLCTSCHRKREYRDGSRETQCNKARERWIKNNPRSK